MRFLICFGLFLGLGLLLPYQPAKAEKLYTVWSLERQSTARDMEVHEDVPFLFLRLIPYKLVKLREAAQLLRGKQIAAGTDLFIVYQADGQVAYCTIKDQSGANAARSLFIPALDRRPCLVDRDTDGRFDANFNVFDKYGSALTPSGNLSSAKPLVAPAAYDFVESSQFSVSRSLAFAMSAVDDPQDRKLTVQYDNGRGFVGMVSSSPASTPERPTALNIAAEVLSASGNTAQVRVFIVENQYVVGDSDGLFAMLPLPPFVNGTKR